MKIWENGRESTGRHSKFKEGYRKEERRWAEEEGKERKGGNGT